MLKTQDILQEKLRTVKAVVFDLDGVILDSEPVHHAAINEICAPYGEALTDAEYEKLIGRTDIVVTSYLKERYSFPFSVEDFISRYNAKLVQSLQEKKTPRVAGVRDFVIRLQKEGKLLAIASSSSKKNIEASLACAELSEYFPVRCSGEDVKKGKPEPDIYLLAAERLGCRPEECAGIEDSDTGLLAVKRAGFLSVGYKNPHSGPQTLQDAEIILEAFV